MKHIAMPAQPAHVTTGPKCASVLHAAKGRSNRNALTAFTFISILLSGAAFAVDGVTEINQAKAIAGGVTPGDAPGFPVTISVPGSYRLTSNLDVTVASSPADTDGVEVDTEHVSIDLNGFSIVGPATAGDGRGIDASFRDHVSVRNGFVRDMGSDGVRLWSSSSASGVSTIGNGGYGILAFNGSSISDCIAHGNGLDGIYVQIGMVHNSIATENQGDGINGNNSSSIRNNTVASNSGDGIEVRFGSTVIGNAIRLNAGFGINVPAGESGYAHNVIQINTAGTVSGSAVEIGPNLCTLDNTCP